MRALLAFLVLTFALAGAMPVLAQRAEPVDVELVIAVDVSRSMTRHELEIQRRGYAAALVSDPVVRAIGGGLYGQVAVLYMEWAGAASQRVVVDWTLLRSRADAEAFAARLTTHFEEAMRRTSISGGIDFAARLFETNGYQGIRRVIDVSGDGPNNDGRPVVPSRDEALARGIVINGLPLMTREGMGSRWHLEDLDRYYYHCVIGGPGAFVVPVLDWQHFPAAVRRKLVLDLAGGVAPPALPARPALIQAAEPGYDCLIGEKIWNSLGEDPL